MFRSDSQRKAMFANMAGGSIDGLNRVRFSSVPDRDSLKELIYRTSFSDVGIETFPDEEISEITDIESVPELASIEEPDRFAGYTVESGIQRYNTDDGAIDELIGKVVNTEVASDVGKLERDMMIDEIADYTAEREVEFGRGRLAADVVSSDKAYELFEELVDSNSFSAAPVSKEVRDNFFGDTYKDNKLGKGVEDVLLYPGAMKYNPVTAFDEDYRDFEKGRIFNSYEKNGKTVTDWKKFSSRPRRGAI